MVGDGNLDGIHVIGTKAVTATGRVIVDPVAAPLVRPGAIEVLRHDRPSSASRSAVR